MSGIQISDLALIVQLGWKLYHSCYLVAKEAPENFRRLVEEVFVLQGVLGNLRDQIATSSNSDSVYMEKLSENSRVAVEKTVDASYQALKDLELLLAKYTGLGMRDRRSFWSRIKGGVEWSQEQNNIEKLRARIQAYCVRLQLCMSMLGNATVTRLAENIEEALMRVDRVEITPTLVDLDDGAGRKNSSSAESSANISLKANGSMLERTSSSSETSRSVFRETAKVVRKSTRSYSDVLASELVPSISDNLMDFSDHGKLSYEELDTVLEEARGFLTMQGERDAAGHHRPPPREPPDPAHLAPIRLAATFDESSKYLKTQRHNRPLTTTMWLRLATWWLLKSRSGIQLYDECNPDESTTSSLEPSQLMRQAHLDLLKVSWILYNVIQKDEVLASAVTDLNAKLYADVESAIQAEFRLNTFSPSSDNEDFWSDFGLDRKVYEKEQEMEKNPISDADRWSTVEKEDAGNEDETVLFRCFVDAGIGPKRLRSRSSNAPYMLLVWAKSGESEPKITLCNQRGSLNLTKDFTDADIKQLPETDGTPKLLPPMELTFPADMRVEVRFRRNSDFKDFMVPAQQYFEAVRDREARPKEKEIFRSVLDVVEGNLFPTPQDNCELRIYESVEADSWRRTRRLVLNSYAGDSNPWCFSYFLPLSRVRVKIEDTRLVSIKWSGLDQTKEVSDGNYHFEICLVYNPEDPNKELKLLFCKSQLASQFELVVLGKARDPEALHTWDEPVTNYVYPKEISTVAGRVQEYRVLLSCVASPSSGWKSSYIYYLPEQLDIHFSANDGSGNSATEITFANAFYTNYISDFGPLRYAPTPKDKAAVQLRKCQRLSKSVCFSFTKGDENVPLELQHVLQAVTSEWKVLAISANVNVSYRISRLKKNRERGTPAEISVWERDDVKRLLVRWDPGVNRRPWLSATISPSRPDNINILDYTIEMRIGSRDNKATIPVDEAVRGNLVDMDRLVAVATTDTHTERLRDSKLNVSFDNPQDNRSFCNASGLAP